MMTYREYFRIEIDHQYFSSQGGADLAIVPDAGTLRLLKGQHCILRETENGLKLLVPTDENGTATSTLDKALVFEVFPKSSTFSLVTDTSSLADGEIFHFSNAGLSAATLQMVSSAAEGGGSLNGFKLVAKVEVQPTAALLSSTASLHYKLDFAAKSAKWKYYVVSDHETTDLQVVDMDGGLVFNAVNWDEDPMDIIGVLLESKFPEANLFLFESETAIAGSDQALRNLQLIRDGHLIIKHLPNPDIGDAATKIIKVQKLISKQ